MITSRRVLVFGILFGAVPLAARQTPAVDGQYLIETIKGEWQVRDRNLKDRELSQRFDVITTAEQIRCVKGPCRLDYSTDGKLKPLFAQPPALNQWVSLPRPKEPPVARTAVEMQQLVGRAAVRGGADKASSTCGGALPLLAPRCREMLDTLEVRLRWTVRPADAGKTYTLIAGATDASERHRWSGINADDGEFQSPSLQTFFESLQRPDRPVDVSLRLVRTENLDAVRLVRLQSTADATEHRRVLRQLDGAPELSRNLLSLEEFLKLEMWSRAADVSRALLLAAPNSIEMQKYALIGFCASDSVTDAARLRSTLRDVGVSGLCDGTGGIK